MRIPRINEELEDLMMYLIGYSTEHIAGVYQEGVDMGLDGESRWSIETVNKLIGMCNDRWGMNIEEVKEE
jgi:hypothetical protein